jgi:hypothetical protein
MELLSGTRNGYDMQRTKIPKLPWRLYKYVFLGGLVIVGLVALLIAAAANDIGFVANLMFLCVCNIALLIPAFLVYMLLVVGNAYLRKANNGVHGQLQRVQAAVTGVEARVESTSDAVSRRVIDFSAQTAKLDAVFDVFERADHADNQRKEDDSHANPRS